MAATCRSPSWRLKLARSSATVPVNVTVTLPSSSVTARQSRRTPQRRSANIPPRPVCLVLLCRFIRSGVIAKKVGITRLCQEDGSHVPLTVMALEDCQGVSHRTVDRDGYVAVQLGAGEAKQKNAAKPQREHFAKAQVPLKKKVAEFRVDGED